jgi:hypothetical protein
MRRILVVAVLWFATGTAGNAQIRLRMPSVRQLRETLHPSTAQSTVSPNFRPADYDRIAVMVVDHSGRSQDGHQRQVEDAFMSAVIAKGYTLAARSDVERVLSELKFESEGATAENVSRLGQMLNVSALLIASIDTDGTFTEQNDGRTSYYTSMAVSARLVSVRQAEVLWVASHSGRTFGNQTRNGDSNIVSSVATAVAVAFPSRMAVTTGGGAPARGNP